MAESRATGDNTLKRTLGPWALIALGIGAFIVAGVGCAFAGLCYAEFASMIPIAGSAYTYSYATMGELLAWIIGWDLVLEYAVGAATVAVSWSGYVASLANDFGIRLPPTLIASPFQQITLADGSLGHGII